MTVVAKFLGKNGSLGYKTGEIYILDVTIDNQYLWVRGFHSACPYSTIQAFLKNWKVLGNLDQLED